MEKSRKGVYKICKCCSKQFYVPIYREKTANFCSVNCLNNNQYVHHIINCKGCKKDFKVSNSRHKQKYCSLDCKSIDANKTDILRKKSKAHSKLARGPTRSKTIKKWLSRIQKLECKICKYDEFDFCLDVHHIDENPTNNNISNIAILCCMCHKKLHKNIINIEGELL